jgi:hypothetical protein
MPIGIELELDVDLDLHLPFPFANSASFFPPRSSVVLLDFFIAFMGVSQQGESSKTRYFFSRNLFRSRQKNY